MARSRAAELLESEADETEIRAAIDGPTRELIVKARAGWRAQAITACDHDDFEDALVYQLGRYLGLTAGGWTLEAKAEWQNIAADELMEYPLAFLLPEVVLARRRVPWPNKFVPAIVEAIEVPVQKFKCEGEKIEKLAFLANLLDS